MHLFISVKWKSVGTLEDGGHRESRAEFKRRCVEPQRRVAIEARAGFYKGTRHTYTLKNRSLNVLLRDRPSATLYPPHLPFNHLSLSLFVALLFLTLFSRCRGVIL